MKKQIVILLALAMMIGLSACSAAAPQNATEATKESTEAATTVATTVPTETISAPTEIPLAPTGETSTDMTAETTVITEATTAPTAAPTEAPTAESTEEPTEETHSEFYATGISVDQIVAYFNKVVLGMENASDGGETALVQKWVQPISYRIEGMPTQQDAKIFHDLEKKLNALEGFPGIHTAKALEQNATIFFLKDAEFETQFSHITNGETVDGIVQLWYGDSNGAHTGRIGYRRDASQQTRDAVIPEKLLEFLGISEVTLQKRTPTNKKDTITVELSELDWAIVKLLYHPRIHNGMNADECEMIIRELYY